jgi:hypothetical protein
MCSSLTVLYFACTHIYICLTLGQPWYEFEIITFSLLQISGPETDIQLLVIVTQKKMHKPF